MSINHQSASQQDYWSVLKAELWWRASSPGLWVAALIAAAVSGACVPGILALMSQVGMTNGSAGDLLLALPVAGFVLVTCFGLGVLVVAGRESSSGILLTMLQLVPMRRRLLLARSSAIALVAFVVSGLWALAVVVVGVFTLDGVDASLGELVLLILCFSLASCLVSLLAFLFISAIPSGVVAASALLLCFVIFPLASGAASVAWPGVGGAVLRWISTALPGSLMVNAMSAGSDSIQHVVSGFVGLIAWCYVFFLLAYMRLRRIG